MTPDPSGNHNYNKALLQLLLEGTGEAVLLLDPEGVIANCSASASIRLGLPQKELVGRNIWELLGETVSRPRKRHVRQVFVTGEPVRHLDEREGLWNDYSIYPVFDDSRSVKQVAVYSRDVTNLKKALDELQVARRAIENTSNPIAISDQDARITFVNQACARLWGYDDKSQICGKYMHEFWEIHLDSEQVKKLLAAEGAWQGIYKGIKKTGEAFSVYTSASAIVDAQRKTIGFIGSFMDMETLEEIRAIRKKIETDYDALLDKLKQGVWKVNAESVTTYVNSQMAEMLKSTKHDIISRPPYNFLTEKSKRIFDEKMRRSRQGFREQYDFELLRDDGTVIETLVDSVPLFDESGNYNGSLAGFIDITARKREEEALRESEEKYRTLVSNMHELIWTCDSEFKTTFINDIVKDYLGYETKEILGKKLHMVHFDEDIPAFEKRLRNRREGLSETYEQRFRTKSGKEAWGLVSVTPYFDKNGDFAGANALVTDITRRKHAEDAFKAIYDRAAVGIMFHDNHGRILAANPFMCDMLGYAEEELMIMSLGKITPPDEHAKIIENFSLLSEDMEVFSERVLLRSDGERLITEAHGKRLCEDMVVEMHRNVTSKRRAERQKEDLERVIRHDLKGILNNVINLPQIIKADANLTEKQKEILGVIEESGKSMLNIIDNHIRIFQIERNSYELRRRNLDIRQFIKGVLYNYASIIAAKELKIQYDHSPARDDGDDGLVYADGSLCHVMLNNVILNAIEAAPVPGGEVRIQVVPCCGMVSIVIQNEGPIPASLMPRFGQKYATTKETGTGVGVYSARLIAQVQDGVFNWRVDEKHTTIEIRLPAARRPA